MIGNTKGVFMQVSAITVKLNTGYNFSNNKPFCNNRTNEQIGDTVFNSLTPFANKKSTAVEKLPQVFDNINEWQSFCHKQILGGKLNVIV